MIFTENVIWARRLFPKILSFIYGITTVRHLAIHHGRTCIHCKPSVGLSTSLVRALKCEDMPGHKPQQELWCSHRSLACGFYF